MEMLCGGEFMCYLSLMNDYQAPWQDDYSLYFYDIF